jgi:hypothetical protein
VRSLRQRPGTADPGRPHGRYRARNARRRVVGCRDGPEVAATPRAWLDDPVVRLIAAYLVVLSSERRLPKSPARGDVVCGCGRELCLRPYSNRWSAGIIAGLLTAYE